MTLNKIKTSELVGGGYNDFWTFRGRYRVCKGSRASKKSKTTVLYYITKLMICQGVFENFSRTFFKIFLNTTLLPYSGSGKDDWFGLRPCPHLPLDCIYYNIFTQKSQ